MFDLKKKRRYALGTTEVDFCRIHNTQINMSTSKNHGKIK